MTYYADASVTIHHGDCLDVLRELPDASVDAVVTDPPYLLGFMGREWDTKAAHQHLDWHRAWCDHAYRVLKPGGHMLAFGGTRTSHRLACAVEDAGFEIRDSIAWLYGSGFPKSLDVSKAIDKAAGVEREVSGIDDRAVRRNPNGLTGVLRLDGFTTVEELEAAAERGEQTPYGRDAVTTLRRYRERAMTVGEVTAPATDAARTWQGWGTALKPAHEPIVVARKPLAGTVAANVLAHGTGALNIDGTRIPGERITTSNGSVNEIYGDLTYNAGQPRESHTAGRWPANVVLDESQAAALDAQSGDLHLAGNRGGTPRDLRNYSAGERGATNRIDEMPASPKDEHVGASRFFYTAKAASSERVKLDGTAHPTVKPLALMRWLVRLVAPPGGTVLEPFAGSGTTVEACILEGFACIAIEREADYLPLIRQRIHRRRDPVEAVRGSGEDTGLFDLLGGEGA